MLQINRSQNKKGLRGGNTIDAYCLYQRSQQLQLPQYQNNILISTCAIKQTSLDIYLYFMLIKLKICHLKFTDKTSLKYLFCNFGLNFTNLLFIVMLL